MTRRIDWDKVKTVKDLKAIFEAWKLTFSSEDFDADFPGLLPYLKDKEEEPFRVLGEANEKKDSL